MQSPTGGQLKNEDTEWLYLAPVAGVQVTSSVRLRYRIDRVELIDRKSLPHRWKRLGLPARMSELRAMKGGVLNEFFGEASTFAVARMKGVGDDVEATLSRLVREELEILTLSQLGFTQRAVVRIPTIGERSPTKLERHLLIPAGRLAASWNSTRVGRPGDLILDQTWKSFQKELFFRNLLRILRGEVKTSKRWRRDLRNAALLVGQGLRTQDVAQAFLGNIIAIELLLAGGGADGKRAGRLRDILPTRVEAFLGWAGDWERGKYEERLRDAYQKRNALVHQGRRDLISDADLHFLDEIVINVFTNLVNHPKLFWGHEAVAEFSRKVEAERTLQINAKVRPQTMSFSRSVRGINSARARV